MKPLSDSLGELAARVKVLEDSATATFEADRVKLEQRRLEIDEAFKEDVSEFESAVRDANQAGRTWWDETKASMKRPLDEVRARIDKRQSEHELHRAQRQADAAEEDAAAAIAVAKYYLNVAEYSAVDATLARMAADDLAAGEVVRSDVMMRPYLGSWRRLAVHGVAAILFGLATLLWPDVSLWALVVLWGAFAFVDGVTALSAAIADPLLRHRGWTAFWGVTGIAAGVVTFVWPSITAEALLIVIATWSLLIGGSQIVFAVRARKQVSDAWAIALGGALLVLLAVLLVINPGAGALGITWAIGWFAFLFGIVQLWLASVVRHETHELTRPTPIQTSQSAHAVG